MEKHTSQSQLIQLSNIKIKPSFIKEVSFFYQGKDYQNLLDEMWDEYITTDSFCERTECDRKNTVLHFNNIKYILQLVEEEIKQ